MAWRTSGEACVTGYGAAWIRAFWTRVDAGLLDHAAELVRTVEHVARLVVGRAGKWLPATEHGRKVTEKLTGQILERDFPDGLESELDRTFGTVRAIYERVLGVSSHGVCAGALVRVVPQCGTIARRVEFLRRLSLSLRSRQTSAGAVARVNLSNLSLQFRRRV